MSSDSKTEAIKTMASKSKSTKPTAESKKLGKRKTTGPVIDAAPSENKKPKVNSVDEAVAALTVLRKGSFDEAKETKTVPNKEEKPAPETKRQEELTDDSESKKDMSMDEFIDIEKAQYTFPERLMELLMNGTVKKAMWWLPGGEAFALVPNTFYEVVLAKYFQGTKFESFTRKLNRWGFKRLSGQGVPKGTIAYYHKMFKKEQQDLMKKMRSGKSSQNQDDGSFGKSATLNLEDAFIPSSLDAAAQLSFLPAQLRGADPASILLAQQAGLLPAAAAAPASDNLALRLQLLNAQVQAEQQEAAMRQLLAQDQSRANALARQLGGNNSSPDFLRQAELLAVEEVRAAQEAQLRARLLQVQAPLGAPGLQSMGSEDQLRLALLQRQLAGRGAW